MSIAACRPYFEPLAPPRLASPAVTGIGIAETKPPSPLQEAIRISWQPPSEDSVAIRSFTLIRKTASDSGFDVFTRSQGIPDSVHTFDDPATPIGFPIDGFFLVSYRLFAVDTLGRPSDTSAACSLYLAPQPTVDTIDLAGGTVRWHTRFIQGSVLSWIKLWNGASGASWESRPAEDFGSYDYPLYFTVGLPDSIRPVAPGTWGFAVFIQAMGPERQSLKVGSVIAF
jgi:hypothetical protein